MKTRPAKANHQIVFNVNHPVPEELLHSLRYEFLRRELWAPLGREAGRIRVVIDDPDNLLKKDMIENLLRTKEVDYYPATKEDILKVLNGDTDFVEVLSVCMR